jgi:hypothetical protein
MARAKKDVTPASVKEAYLTQGEAGAVKACILKYAETIDAKDSARDMKPLISGMFEAIDRLKALESRDGNANADTALFKILKAANG